ncbi:sensor histidine kinase [Teredinibacter waterburyi]|jgi:hypothetical protein|uniref:sensor histidine kinase n=1 Tax=Teredinibacter waterburyi TaxID=1500538 RepID=UPI00165F8922|nr:sensor histidine kinase [Teredinibacter waterburyi]
MFSFFIPTSKVQKDRRIMRETDARMAKYSRRGLFFNFIAYLICLIGGRFIDENRDLTIVLTIGLLLITFLRGFFLFRFDQLYPRAPQRWRNGYFVATLLGSIWWAVILVSVTLKLEMQDEAPLLWLYTVVFFSTTAHAFAPYQRFLSYYQFFGLIPAAGAAFALGDVTVSLYGLLTLVFYLVLSHQCRLISENYWERLEAIYALARKAQSIEEEKRDTRASAQLNQEFLGCLRNDLENISNISKTAFADLSDGKVDVRSVRACERSFNKVYSNVSDFNSILGKELVLENRIFNIRHELQQIVAEYTDESESQGVVIETSLSPTLPMRLKGDAARFAKIIRTLLGQGLRNIDTGLLLLDVEFLREFETSGELYINVSSHSNVKAKGFFGSTKNPIANINLSFSVAKGLAEFMGGGIEIQAVPNEGPQYRFNAKFEIAEHAGHLDFHQNSFAGHQIMMVHSNTRLTDAKQRELEALGLEVHVEHQFKRAQQQLINSYKDGRPIKMVFYYLENDNQELVEFNNFLCEHPELRYTHQLVASSNRQQRLFERVGFMDNDTIHFVHKPAGLFELEAACNEVFRSADIVDEGLIESALVDGELPESESINAEHSILIVVRDTQAEAEYRKQLESPRWQVVAESDLKKVKSLLAKEMPSLVLIDTDDEIDVLSHVNCVREAEDQLEKDFYLPILGVSLELLQVDSSVYELGVDDYIDLSAPKVKLKGIVECWINLMSDDSNN